MQYYFYFLFFLYALLYWLSAIYIPTYQVQSKHTNFLIYTLVEFTWMFWYSQIVNSNGVKRLHKRVEQSMLKYSTLERRGWGVAKVGIPLFPKLCFKLFRHVCIDFIFKPLLVYRMYPLSLARRWFRKLTGIRKLYTDVGSTYLMSKTPSIFW